MDRTNDMSTDHDWGDNCFSCQECGKVFRNPLFTLACGYEEVIFYEDGGLPEIETSSSESIGTFCSLTCLEQQRNEILKNENVGATCPGIGPVEKCARCGESMDTTRPHKTWLEEHSICHWDASGDFSIQPFEVRTLARVCQDCLPRENA